MGQGFIGNNDPYRDFQPNHGRVQNVKDISEIFEFNLFIFKGGLESVVGDRRSYSDGAKSGLPKLNDAFGLEKNGQRGVTPQLPIIKQNLTNYNQVCQGFVLLPEFFNCNYSGVFFCRRMAFQQ